MGLMDSIIAEFDSEVATTRRVLERVPADKLDWRPHPKSFTLGQLAFHVAQTPGGVSRMAMEDVFTMPEGFKQDPPTTVEQILATLDEGSAAARKRLAEIDDARAMGNWSFVQDGQTMMTIPRIGVIRMIMLNHWYHHRGQLTVYLRQLDVPLPSVYGPSADENPFA